MELAGSLNDQGVQAVQLDILKNYYVYYIN